MKCNTCDCLPLKRYITPEELYHPLETVLSPTGYNYSNNVSDI